MRKQFTGYEHDDETDLDFAEARMYAKSLGRFTTVDPLMVSADIVDPLTFNRYTYLLNIPLNLTVPSGQIWGALNGIAVLYDTMDALKAAGATVYTSLIGTVNGQFVLVNPNVIDYTFVTSNAQALQKSNRGPA